MKLKELILMVEFIYKHVYNKMPLNINQMSNLVYEIKYPKELIRADKSISNRYRITFEQPVGTIEQFSLYIDKALGIPLYDCDTSNYIDLTAAHIMKVINYYNIKVPK